MRRPLVRIGRALTIVGLSLSICTETGAESLGRLFFTPQERSRLDQRRAGGAPAEPERPLASASHVTGFVQRGDGKTTVWIDGQPRYHPEDITRLGPSTVQTSTPILIQRASNPSTGK